MTFIFYLRSWKDFYHYFPCVIEYNFSSFFGYNYGCSYATETKSFCGLSIGTVCWMYDFYRGTLCIIFILFWELLFNWEFSCLHSCVAYVVPVRVRVGVKVALTLSLRTLIIFTLQLSYDGSILETTTQYNIFMKKQLF